MPSNSALVLEAPQQEAIQQVIERLLRDARARSVFLIEKNGQLLASSGETEELDKDSLASLTAGNIAATGGLAKVIGEQEFSILFHEGEKDNLHLSLVAERMILVVLFDERSSLGLVRLRLKRATNALEKLLEEVLATSAQPASSNPLAEITDEDIDNLFK